MQHSDLWRGLDLLAAERGLSTSALARLANLDPTTFNPSKRQAADGRGRWPSSESLAKVLSASGVSLQEFAAIIAGVRPPAYGETLPPGRNIPLLSLADASHAGFDAAGFPAKTGWQAASLPAADDPHAYALQVADDTMAPTSRQHDLLVVSPTALVQAGDKVVLRSLRGELLVRQLVHRGSKRLEFRGFGPDAPVRLFDATQIAFVHRIQWISQ